MYPFLTMNDHTEIVYSHLLDSGRVKIYVEKPDEYDGFHHAACFLPSCRWEDIVGFSDAEIQEYKRYDADVFTGVNRRTAAVFQFHSAALRRLNKVGCQRYEGDYTRLKQKHAERRARRMAG